MDFEVYQIGEQLDSFNSQEVQDGIKAIMDKGSNVVIDMTACDYISSTGLRVLLYSKKLTAAKGLHLYLVGVRDKVKDVMEVTGFNTFFESFSTMEECMEKVKD